MPADHEKLNVPTGAPGEPDPQVVYNKRTGERIERHAVDCKELVATGEWGYAPPSDEERADAEKAEEEKLAEQAEARAAEAPALPVGPLPVAPPVRAPATKPGKK
jgi:hypothetical protein